MTNPPEPERDLTTAEAAAVMGVHEETMRRYADAGRVRHRKLPSGQRRFRRVDVEAARDAGLVEVTPIDEDPASEPAPELRSA